MNSDIPDILNEADDVSSGDTTKNRVDQGAIEPGYDSQLASVPSPPVNGAGGLNASDVDVIEKEWVNLVQNIVNSTQDSPYTQQKEISKVKAQYMQKRYGKTVRLAEDK